MNKFTIIGLGNPGAKYSATRHNAGKMFVEWVKKRPAVHAEAGQAGRPRRREAGQAGLEELEMMGTNCFMNESGSWIYNFYKNYNHYKDYSRLLVAFDDLDLSLGQFKINFAKGPEGHKGLLSIYQALGTEEFWHVRIGIDNRKSSTENRKTPREDGEAYVLKPFKKEEREALEQIFPKIMEELENIWRNKR